MIGIVVSRADEASVHIGEHLLDLADWREDRDGTRPDSDGGGVVHRTDGFELREFDDLHLHLDGVAAAFDDPEFVVFASRHSGDTGPLLTAHFTGNFGPAEFGGRDRALARACPNAQKRVVAALAEHAPDGYEVGTECTHHGPSEVGVPSMFVELGSGEDEWRDPEGARAVAQAILDLRGVAPDADRAVAWFGGGHYAPRPARVLRETDWAVGHVAADWCLDEMGDPGEARDVVAQAFAESRAERAVVAADDPDLERVIEDLGYRAVGETWVRETDGVPLALVEALEAALSRVEDGLRFGDPAEGYDGDWTVVDLPGDLVSEATGIDREAVFDAARETALAFETEEGGTLVSGRAAFADDGGSAADDGREAFVARLLDVLQERYDDVTRDGSEVIARQSAFDPERARELGVPEGPAFGRLADGDAVTVEGREVHPDEVRTEEVRRFDLGALAG